MDEVQRRRFLEVCAVASLSLAGCSSDSPPTESPIDTSMPRGTSPPTSTPKPTPSSTVPRTDAPTDQEPPADTESPTATPASQRVATEAWRVDRLTGLVRSFLLPEAGPADDPSGPLYAATGAGEVAQVDAVSGKLAWAMTTHGETDDNPALTPAPETLFAVSETYTDDRLANHVEAVDPTTGEVRWRYDDRMFLRVLGVVDNLVVLAGEDIDKHPEKLGPMRSPRGDGHLVGLTRETGEAQWTVDIPELHGANVASHGAYATEWQHAEDTQRLVLHAINLDGTERWTSETGTQNPAIPAVDEELLLAGASKTPETSTGGIGRYEPADGSLVWTTGRWERGPDDIKILDNAIYAGGNPLLALNRDGSERYRANWHTVPDLPGTPETLYAAGGSYVHALDRAHGKSRWEYSPEEYKYTHIRAVLSDYLAVDRGIGPDHGVVLLDEMDGSIAGRFVTPEPYSAAIGSGQRLFLGVGTDIIAYDVAITRQ